MVVKLMYRMVNMINLIMAVRTLGVRQDGFTPVNMVIRILLQVIRLVRMIIRMVKMVVKMKIKIMKLKQNFELK